MKIPVILDTDIGTDIDDTWALGLLLKCPELDVKLISCVSGDTQYRAKIVAKFLEKVNRTDIPIAYNKIPPKRRVPKMQSKWVQDYNIESYPGQLFVDAPRVICETASHIEPQLTIISIGPLTNLAEALKLDPKIGTKARFVGMQGSIYKGYFGISKPHREYNVIADVASSRIVFRASWLKLITPLDTCWLAIIKGSLYHQLRVSHDPIVEIVMENYRIWAKKFVLANYRKKSTNLFDTVAIYLAIAESFVEIEELPLIIDEKGFTKIDPAGTNVRCAVRWKSLEEYLKWLVNRLLS